jgi:hypothetical protein
MRREGKVSSGIKERGKWKKVGEQSFNDGITTSFLFPFSFRFYSMELITIGPPYGRALLCCSLSSQQLFQQLAQATGLFVIEQ